MDRIPEKRDYIIDIIMLTAIALIIILFILAT